MDHCILFEVYKRDTFKKVGAGWLLAMRSVDKFSKLTSKKQNGPIGTKIWWLA